MGVQIGGLFISCEVNCQFNFNVNMLAASAIDSEGWSEFIAGLRSWTVTVDGQLLADAVGADFKTILNAVFLRQTLLITVGTRQSATTQMSITGNALPSSGSFTGPNKGVSTWTVTFQGTGAPVASFEDFGIIIDSMPASEDYPIIYDLDVT